MPGGSTSAASIPAGHRPPTSPHVRPRQGELRYFRAVLLPYQRTRSCHVTSRRVSSYNLAQGYRRPVPRARHPKDYKRSPPQRTRIGGPEHIDIHADGLAGEVDRLGPEHSGLRLDFGISHGQAEELLQQRIHQADWFVAEYLILCSRGCDLAIVQCPPAVLGAASLRRSDGGLSCAHSYRGLSCTPPPA